MAPVDGGEPEGLGEVTLARAGRSEQQGIFALAHEAGRRELEDLLAVVEIDQALRKLRLSGMADTLETRLLEAQSGASRHPGRAGRCRVEIQGRDRGGVTFDERVATFSRGNRSSHLPSPRYGWGFDLMLLLGRSEKPV